MDAGMTLRLEMPEWFAGMTVWITGIDKVTINHSRESKGKVGLGLVTWRTEYLIGLGLGLIHIVIFS